MEIMTCLFIHLMPNSFMRRFHLCHLTGITCESAGNLSIFWSPNTGHLISQIKMSFSFFVLYCGIYPQILIFSFSLNTLPASRCLFNPCQQLKIISTVLSSNIINIIILNIFSSSLSGDPNAVGPGPSKYTQ